MTEHLLKNALVALVVTAVSLIIGMAGYHWLAPMPWVDAFLNAAMLLGGMGPVDALTNDSAKLFAGLIATSGLLIAPLGAHVLRRFHLAQDKSS